MPLLCVISYFSSQIFIYNLQVWNFPKNSSRKSQWYLEKIPCMVSEDELFWEKIPWTKSKVSTISWKNSMNGVGRRAIWKNSMDQIEVKYTLVCFDRNVASEFVKTRPESLKDILKKFLEPMPKWSSKQPVS